MMVPMALFFPSGRPFFCKSLLPVDEYTTPILHVDAEISCDPLDHQVRLKILTTSMVEAKRIDSMPEISEYGGEEVRVCIDEEISICELLASIGQQRLEMCALFTESVLSSGKDRIRNLETNDSSLWRAYT